MITARTQIKDILREAGMQNMSADFMEQLDKKVKQLILVSHEQKIEGFVDNILHFKKIDGITEVEK